MTFYEGMFILPQTYVRENKEQAFELLKGCIEKIDGQIEYIDIWSERRMSYPINHVRDVSYILVYFNASGEGVRKVERIIQLEEDILRCMILRPDKNFDLDKFKEELKEKENVAIADAVESEPATETVNIEEGESAEDSTPEVEKEVDEVKV